jgi:hypothetical protein
MRWRLHPETICSGGWTKDHVTSYCFYLSLRFPTLFRYFVGVNAAPHIGPWAYSDEKIILPDFGFAIVQQPLGDTWI